MSEKRCGHCGHWKDRSEFTTAKTKDGLNNWCKGCVREYQQTESYREALKRYRQSDKWKAADARHKEKRRQQRALLPPKPPRTRKEKPPKVDRGDAGIRMTQTGRGLWELVTPTETWRFRRRVSNAWIVTMCPRKPGAKWVEMGRASTVKDCKWIIRDYWDVQGGAQ